MAIQLKGNATSSYSSPITLGADAPASQGSTYYSTSVDLRRDDGGSVYNVFRNGSALGNRTIILNSSGSASFAGGGCEIDSFGSVALDFVAGTTGQVFTVDVDSSRKIEFKGDGSAKFGTGTIGAASNSNVVQIHSGYGQIQVQSDSGGNALYRGYNSDGTATFTVRGNGQGTFLGGVVVGTSAITLSSSGTIVSQGTYSTTAPSPRSLFISSDGTFGGVSSVRASKKNIDYDYDSSWIYDLKPVSFNYRKQDEETQAYTEETYEDGQYGLIAEDVEEINREICNYDGDKLLGVEYMKLITPILSQLKQANARIEALEAQLTQLTGGAN